LNGIISDFANIYGEEHVGSNVHNLFHLPDNVKFFNAPKMHFSASKYESYLQKIEVLVKNHSASLEQSYDFSNVTPIISEIKFYNHNKVQRYYSMDIK
jgi:hypothetical protein